MKLVVGLGNPGPQYAQNRHNAGFMVLDELIRRCQSTTTDKFKGQMARGRVGQIDTILLKPMTYMNNSGVSVGMCASFYKIAPEDTLIVHDELDLDYGVLRVKRSGGHGGHNGLRSIFEHFNKGDFPRVRVGIGHPQHGSTTNWVLGNFSSDQSIDLDHVIERAANGVQAILEQGVDSAMNQFNQKPTQDNKS
jgi:PTH1 family peptidyl-tRNA hydrolase